MDETASLKSVPAGWKAALGEVLAGPEARRLGGFLRAEETAGKRVYPPRGLRLRALELTALDEVKVVILGQDPYHGEGQAHGLAFSVPEGVKVPPSLANIRKELQSDLGLQPGNHGNLESWARQGVLLLNTSLTVEQGLAASHKGRGWETFTDAVIGLVAEREQPCAFLLWGSHAQKKAGFVDGNRHLVLKAPHPSPLSAYAGFLGCRHFSRTNQWLTAQGQPEIDWALPPP